MSFGLFRRSQNSVKVKSAAGSFRGHSGEPLIDESALAEVASELRKIPRNDLAAVIDRTILPRIQVRALEESQRS
jgi:hypothetical protein